MHASSDDLATLLRIQQIDLSLAQTEKRLQALPQRQTILECRAKRREILVRKQKLEELRADADARFAALEDEDQRLADKQVRTQEEIDSAQGGYRDVEARTKELNGLAKRRVTLEGDISAVGEELGRIEALQAQVESALAGLEAREKEATEVFVREGGALKQSIAQAQAQRAQLASTVTAPLMATYEKTAKRCGGVALGRLNGSTCGVCRSSIERGRLIDMKSSGNLVACPNCGRLLIMVNTQTE